MSASTLNVSIIVPTFNRVQLLPRALDSILSQVEAGDEILVADDASTDNTAEFMRRYEGRVRYQRFEHGGAGRTRNRALQLTDRPLVAYLDSDDEWLPGKLALQRQLFQARNDLVLCFSDFICEYSDGHVDRRHLRTWNIDRRGWDYILGAPQPYSSYAALPSGVADFKVYIGDMYLRELEGDHILTSTMMVRRDAAGEELHFAEDLPVLENKECFGRLTRRGPAAYLDVETGMQNGHSGPRLSQSNKLNWANARIAIIERVWGSDPDFAARHGAALQKALRYYHLERAKLLLTLGRAREARSDLSQVSNCPVKYRLVSALPETLLQGMMSVRRRLRGVRS